MCSLSLSLSCIPFWLISHFSPSIFSQESRKGIPHSLFLLYCSLPHLNSSRRVSSHTTLLKLLLLSSVMLTHFGKPSQLMSGDLWNIWHCSLSVTSKASLNPFFSLIPWYSFSCISSYIAGLSFLSFLRWLFVSFMWVFPGIFPWFSLLLIYTILERSNPLPVSSPSV